MAAGGLAPNQVFSGACTVPNPNISTFQLPTSTGVKTLIVFNAQHLGGGNFGDVFKGQLDGQNVAVKRFKRDDIFTHQEFMTEYGVMCTLNTRHVVKLFYAKGPPNPFLVLEYMEGGDLKRKLDKWRQQGHSIASIGTQAMATIMADIADGMLYLSDKGLIHRDLAARNILISSSGTYKVADLGLGRATGMGGYYTMGPNGVVPKRWTAPEAIATGRFTTKADIWSYGIVVWEISTMGGTPYGQCSTDVTIQQSVTSGYTNAVPPGTPNFMCYVMSSCWQYAKEKRPSFSQIMDLLRDSGSVPAGFYSYSYYTI